MDGPNSDIPLIYSIHGCSDYSGRFGPENVLYDCPEDINSRWCTEQFALFSMKHWILLRLDSPSIVKSITFGKHYKKHPCNMRDFKVYAGMTPDNLTEVLQSHIQDDAVPETFPLRHQNVDGVVFPSQFIKVVPLSGHMQTFQISLWHVSMRGIVDPVIVDDARIKYNEYTEILTMKHILKHLRRKGHTSAYRTLMAQSGVQLEHPLITKMYENIVLHGDWARAEETLRDFADQALFDAYILSCDPRSRWRRLDAGKSADAKMPGRRGGHAMCLDSEGQQLYLFGGWDGEKCLDDFWRYDVRLDRWFDLHQDLPLDATKPAARSCHRIVFNPHAGEIYLLGGLLSDNPVETLVNSMDIADSPPSLRSELHRYHTRGPQVGRWERVMFDTASQNGPALVYNHHMAVDNETQFLYVFGGRIVDGDAKSHKYSGLYMYDMSAGLWKSLQPDFTMHYSTLVIPPRCNHSMVLDSQTHMLYVFGGQRDDKHLSDMFAFDTVTGIVTEISPDIATDGGPAGHSSYRAAMDSALQEIYVFSGPSPKRLVSFGPTQDFSKTWLYRCRSDTWKDIPVERHSGGSGSPPEIPPARFAHQVVYDDVGKKVYLHGGSTRITPVSLGRTEDEMKETRLNDLWCMTLERPSVDEVIRRCLVLVRQQQFQEMCETGPPVAALGFLQTEVSSVVDHSNGEEVEAFQSLVSYLLTAPSPPPTPRLGREGEVDADQDGGDDRIDMLVDGNAHRNGAPKRGEGTVTLTPSDLSPALLRRRTEVFEMLLKFAPAHAQQPASNIMDMVDRYGQEVYS